MYRYITVVFMHNLTVLRILQLPKTFQSFQRPRPVNSPEYVFYLDSKWKVQPEDLGIRGCF